MKRPAGGKYVQITAGDSYEECIELLPDQSMIYSFVSSKNVSFNLHYHGDESIYYPVKEKYHIMGRFIKPG